MRVCGCFDQSIEMQHVEIIITGDGSTSLLNTTLNETYHSRHGALRESVHVFIDHGLTYFLNQHNPSEVRILEVGFGTGLNTLLTLQHAFLTTTKIHYTTIEAYPLGEDIWSQLNYTEGSDEHQKNFKRIHESAWDSDQPITSNFTLIKRKTRIQDVEIPLNHFNLVYFDAFAPSKQPELWSLDVLMKVTDTLMSGGVFVTYCAKGQLKRDLRSLGLIVETLMGPPGKKEMTRAIKPW